MRDSDPSVEIMIAEHERIAQLYIHNREMGEKRISLYLTILSIGSAGFALVPHERGPMLGYACVMSTAMVVLGLVTFLRLVERHVNAVCYLRAINRVHRYFGGRDENLAAYFFWPASDDQPPYTSTGPGLGDMMLYLNSVMIGIALATLQLYLDGFSYLTVIALVVATVLAILGHMLIQRKVMQKAFRSC